MNLQLTEADSPEALALQIKPNEYGNVIPFSVGIGTTLSYPVAVTATSAGPKFYVSTNFQNPQVGYVFPNTILSFDVSDTTNFGYTLSFSTTPDGTHQGGTDYSTNVARVGTPGTTGATVSLTFTQTTPKELTFTLLNLLELVFRATMLSLRLVHLERQCSRSGICSV